MNLKSLSLAVSALLICSSAFATTVDIQVKDNAKGEVWLSGLAGQNVIQQGEKISNDFTNPFTLTPMEFDEANQREIAGMATVILTSRDKIRVDCNLANGEFSKLVFNYYDSENAKLASLVCKPGDDPKSRAVSKRLVERLEIMYQKNGK